MVLGINGQAKDGAMVINSSVSIHVLRNNKYDHVL
jgi:hypothetical protein